MQRFGRASSLSDAAPGLPHTLHASNPCSWLAVPTAAYRRASNSCGTSRFTFDSFSQLTRLIWSSGSKHFPDGSILLAVKGKSTSTFQVKVKCTFVQALRLCTGRTAHRGSRGIALLFLDHGTRRGEGSASRPGRSLSPGKTRYPLYRRLDGPQGRSGKVRKMSPPPGFDLRTAQPVASRYTDWAIPAHIYQVVCYDTRKYNM